MTLSSLCIHRPVLTWVLTIAIILFGAISFTYLSVREYPNIDPSIISISTSYTGASAEVIETQITEPLEDAVSSVPGIRAINSTSREGRSGISIEFELGVDLETAADDVRDKVSGAIGDLPADADPPSVAKADADAMPILMININSPSRDLLNLTALAEDTFKEMLQTINGVSEISLMGEKQYAMRLWMDPIRLASYRLTPQDVRNAVNSENVELPAGSIEGDTVELTIGTKSRLETVDEFNDVIIRDDGGRIIRFRDIGWAELGAENLKSISKSLAGPRVAIAVVPQPGSDHIAIADEVYRRIEMIRSGLPDDIELSTVYDSTRYIRRAIAEVRETIVIAFALVAFIIFVFLRDWRTTIIPILAIPVSLVGTFFIMYLAGFSINVLTLLGLVLAIGLVVDDAIIVLEVIYSRIERGADPIDAGVSGSKEVYFAIISTTLALIVVFLPIVFMQGFTGRLFKEFGIVIGGAVAISAFVSLTLTPMLSTRLIAQDQKHNRFHTATEPFFERLNNLYSEALLRFLNLRRTSAIILVAASIGAWFFYSALPRELAPMEDRGRLRISATAPEGTSFEQMEKQMDLLLDIVRKSVPEAASVIASTGGGWGGGSSAGNMTISLVSRELRKRSQDQIARDLTREVRELKDIRAFVSQEQTITAGGGGRARFSLPVQFIVLAPTLDKLKAIVPSFFEQATANPVFSAVDINLKFNKPQLQVEIDRIRARAMGVSVTDIAQTLQLTLAGQRFGYFTRQGRQYPIIGQLVRSNRDEPSDIGSIFTRTRSGQLIQLDNLVQVTEFSNPPQLYRFNRFVSATFSAGLAPGYTLGDGIDAMQRIAKTVLDDSFRTAVAGAARDFTESSSSLVFVFLLSLLMTYLVLAAQFESFRDPLIIMLTVPLAVAGAMISLWYFNQSINIFSQIGQIMLVGLVTKNGILIVEFANQRKAQGYSVEEAVRSAAASRFRPILMTNLATVLGILPIALGIGAGSESRVSMGIAVVGGLIFSGGLTLFIIPAVYAALTKGIRQKMRHEH